MGDEWELENFANAYRSWIERSMGASGYSILLDYLHDVEFEWVIPEDGRRAKDGIYLRARFESESGLPLPDGWEDWPCSFLEMLVALSYSMEDVLYDPEKGTSPAAWFWTMLSNIGLRYFDDGFVLRKGKDAYERMDDAVERVMSRDYRPDGRGGLFPLRNPLEDQRDVELWYQLNEYVMENGLP